jgi:serine/threonine protein kinase
LDIINPVGGKGTVEAFDRWHVGDLIDNRFKIDRILLGSMGVVYVCVEEETNVPCAIKTFQDKYLLDEKSRNLFVREADAWISFENHINIVKAKGVEILYGKPYILLEYVNGGSLRDKLKGGRLTVSQALYFGIQFCDGMICANRLELGGGKKGIVHRDIKPDNIMLTKDNVLKISDFGLVKALDEAVEGIAGTPAYMSSEQFSAGISFTTQKPVDCRSDIYSFGVVLYEMLAGQRPFDGLGVKECAFQHMYQSPPRLRQINSIVPRELEKIVLKCLEKKPEDRFQSFEDLRHIYFEISGERVSVYIVAQPEAWELSNQGLSLVELGRIDEGIAVLKQTILQYPNDSWAHLNLGHAYIKKEWTDRAIAELRRTLELDPKNVKAYLNLGSIYIRKGQPDQAITELKRATELDPNRSETHVNLGIAYAEKGWLDQAITELKRATELDPNKVKAHCNLGASYIRKGWIDQAITELKRATELDPYYAAAHSNLGLAYHGKGWLDQAITELKWAIELNPNLPAAHTGLGLVYRDKGWIDQAITELKRATELDPNLALAHYNLGILYGRKGWFDQAITELKRATELDPNRSETHVNLGIAYAEKGWFDQAITELKRAIELDPNNAKAHSHLALTGYCSRRFDLAWKHVRIAERLGMPTQNIVKLITLLRKVSREP